MQIININIDGLDCSGKETLSKKLETYLASKYTDVHRYSFPRYETPIGKRIKVLLMKEHRTKDDENELLELFYQDHIDFISDVNRLVEQSDSEKLYLVCDRSVNSMLIYNNVSSDAFDRIRDVIEYKYQQFEELYELNVFVSMMNSRDDRELNRRLLAKENKDANETLEKQRAYNNNIFKARIDLARIQKPYSSNYLKFINLPISLSECRLDMLNKVLHELP